MLTDILASFIEHCTVTIDESRGVFVTLFLAGLLGSVTHCVGMCGPFVLTQAGEMKRPKDAVLLSYHLGRITTYTILAGIFYSLVNVVSFFSPLKIWITAPLLLLAGLIFLVNGLPSLLKTFPWVGRISLPMSRSFINKVQKHVSKIPGMFGRYFLGMILGLMPCGLVVAALMVAATGGNLLASMMGMMIFGLGTMPALIGLVLGKQKLEKRFPEKVSFLRSAFFVWSGLWIFVTVSVMVLKG